MIDRISKLGFEKTVKMIWEGRAGVVLCCTMNEIMMADSDGVVRAAMNRADILTPDGMPLVWYLRWKCGIGERVYGPDLMRRVLSDLKQTKKTFVFIGDDKNQAYFKKYGEYLLLPYKDQFEEADYSKIAKKIKLMKAAVVWVGLGARKQVLMADGLKRYGVKVSIVTVGAAFDFLSGNMVQAPQWIRGSGLEWLFRVIREPKRLWSRYLAIIVFGVRLVYRRLVGSRKKKW